jgi:hypothetical protein
LGYFHLRLFYSLKGVIVIKKILVFVFSALSFSAFPMDALRQRAAAYEQAVEQRGLDGLKKPAALKMVYFSPDIEHVQEGCWHNVSTACGEAGCACLGLTAGFCVELIEIIEEFRGSKRKND